MESVTGELVAIKISPLFVGIGITLIIFLCILIYIKKKK